MLCDIAPDACEVIRVIDAFSIEWP
jgi:hypothetical protein